MATKFEFVTTESRFCGHGKSVRGDRGNRVVKRGPFRGVPDPGLAVRLLPGAGGGQVNSATRSHANFSMEII